MNFQNDRKCLTLWTFGCSSNKFLDELAKTSRRMANGSGSYIF